MLLVYTRCRFSLLCICIPFSAFYTVSVQFLMAVCGHACAHTSLVFPTALIIPGVVTVECPMVILYNYRFFAIEFVAFAIEFVPFAIEFVSIVIEFVPFAIEFVGFAIEFVAFALQFVINKMAPRNQPVH